MYWMMAFAVGLVLGALATELFARARKAQALAEAESQSRATVASLTERLNLKQQEIDTLREDQARLETKIDELGIAINKETEVRSTAVERANRVPILEREIELKDAERNSLLEQLSNLKSRNKELETLIEEERKVVEEKMNLLRAAKDDLSNAFKALSADALKSNNQSFLELAKETLERFQSAARGDLEQRQKAVENLVAPLKETLEKYDQQIQAIENSRREDYGQLSQQVHSLLLSEQKLQAETGNLVKALRTPQVRGRWGELTLRRVVELAGMSEYCDFKEQETVDTDEGRLRPDMVVKLPGGKNIVIDSKVPLSAYLQALEAPDEESRNFYLKDHARQIRSHLQKLSGRLYWDALEATPEFVILFIPGESFYSAALELDPQLIEEGVHQRVIMATPVTLIALLRAVAYGWRQERIAESAQIISELGKLLYERLVTLTDHFDDLGRNLRKSVEAYSNAVASLESRVLVAARRFKELGVTAQKEIKELSPIDLVPREIQSPELVRLPTGEQDESV